LGPGPVYTLDFRGHGSSEWLVGGAYQAELLACDADAALATLGDAAIAGAGLGAYVALLLAGARRDHVPAALLLPGSGLAGGGSLPDFTTPRPSLEVPDGQRRADLGYDPMVAFRERDTGPADHPDAVAAAAP